MLTLLENSKENMQNEDDRDTNCNWCCWNNLQKIDKGTRGGGGVKHTQTTVLLRLYRILRRVLET